MAKEEAQRHKTSPKRTPNPKKKGGRLFPFNWTWFYITIILSLFIGNFFFTGGATEIEPHVFYQMLREKEIERIVVVNGNSVEIDLRESALDNHQDKLGTRTSPPHFHFNIGDERVFISRLDEAQSELKQDDRIEPEYQTRTNYFMEILGWVFPFILILGLWYLMFNRMNRGGGVGGGIFNVGKSKAKIFDPNTKVKTSFRDVAGLAEAKQEIQEIVDFLKNPGNYTRLGGKIPKGALLIGPPGTGKTLLAKAVAGEAHVPFFSMSGSDFVEMFVGVGASRVRDLFRQAKEKAPCIVFIDEIDAIGRARGKQASFSSNDERENTLNQLLTEMDGFETNSGVILLAATNRADVLDNALSRAGRFDRQIHLDLPELKDRKEIFDVHLRPLKSLNRDITSDFLARQTPGFSGADIANVCNEAALIAARKKRKKITRADFTDAVDRIVGGLEKRNKIFSDEERRSVAFHEAGHASISWLLPHAHPLVKVTIVPRGKSLGAAWYLPNERQLTTYEHLLDEMCATLGGRAAEEIFIKSISTGAQNDLERVTKMASAMVTVLGMSSKLGNISYYDSSGSEYTFTKPYSEKRAELIDEEVSHIIEEQYNRAKEILKRHQAEHHKIAEMLLDKEVIFAEDMEAIFGKRESKKQKKIKPTAGAPKRRGRPPKKTE